MSTLEPGVSLAEHKADQLSQEGLAYYQNWQLEQAIDSFLEAIKLKDDDPNTYLNLAQCYARLSDYESMRYALGEFIFREHDQTLIDRFERLFGNMMDSVEQILTETMVQHAVSLNIIGAAMQLWLDFRIAVGRAPINVGGLKPWAWAGALDYTSRKVNLQDLPVAQIADWYQVSAEAVLQQYRHLVTALDIMPCDYRYFRGAENPLDRLVEVALMLEELEDRFHQHNFEPR